MKRDIGSTEAIRNLSDWLNQIKYRGDRYAVTRGGKPAAAMVPVEGSRGWDSISLLPGIVRALPGLDSDDAGFEADVMATARAQLEAPEALPWE